MKLKVTLNGNTQALVDLHEPIVLPENELVLSFGSDIYNLSTLHVGARNGEQEMFAKLNPGAEFDITPLLIPGVLEIDVSMLKKGEAVKTWRVPDIFIKDINHRFEITPEIAEIRGALKEITEILKKNNLL